jgi:hypothetical protein
MGWMILATNTQSYQLVIMSLFMIDTTMAFINVIGEAVVVEQS